MPSTLVDLIAPVPAGNPAVVLPDVDVAVTYGTLRRHVEMLAGTLAAAGIRQGEPVAIALPNGLPLIVAVLAASSIGPAVLLNASSDEAQLRSLLNEAAARVVVVPADAPESVWEAVGASRRGLAIGMDRAGRLYMTQTTLKGSEPEAGTPSRDEVSPRSLHRPQSDPNSLRRPDDIAVVLWTRGTTGRPRRIGLSHANLSISATHVSTTLDLRPDDKCLCVMPIAHVHGLVTAALATLSTGGTLVLPAAFHPLSFWRVARDYGVTWYSAAPDLHQWLLARTADPGSRRPAGAANLRFIRSTGSMLPQAVRQTLESAFGAPVIEAYEVTEAAGEVASTAVDRLRPRRAPPSPPGTSVRVRLLGCVGRATAARIAILDPAGNSLPPDTRGEVAIAGSTVVRGYEDDADATSKFFVGGWFRTGDLGYLDADGYLTLVGLSDREKDPTNSRLIPNP